MVWGESFQLTVFPHWLPPNSQQVLIFGTNLENMLLYKRMVWGESFQLTVFSTLAAA